jgi:hypothetical protein
LSLERLELREGQEMASGIGFFVGFIFAGVIFVISLLASMAFSPHSGAAGYAAAIYVLFAIMAVSSWSIQVRKNDAWAKLNKLEQRVLHRHRAFFYFPFGASNFARFCNFTRMFAVLWAIYCIWNGWYWLSVTLALFYLVSTPFITVWLPIPNYQKCVQLGHQWAQERLKAMQHIVDERDALGF